MAPPTDGSTPAVVAGKTRFALPRSGERWKLQICACGPAFAVASGKPAHILSSASLKPTISVRADDVVESSPATDLMSSGTMHAVSIAVERIRKASASCRMDFIDQRCPEFLRPPLSEVTH